MGDAGHSQGNTKELPLSYRITRTARHRTSADADVTRHWQFFVSSPLLVPVKRSGASRAGAGSVLLRRRSCAQLRAGCAVAYLCSSFGSMNNRLLCFEYIVSASSASMETVQLLRLQSNSRLSGCLSCRELRAHVCAVCSADEDTTSSLGSLPLLAD